MSLIWKVLTGCAIIGLAGCGASHTTGDSQKEAKSDDNKSKIVGTWELVKSSQEHGPKAGDLTIAFTKDGTTMVIIKVGGGKTEKKDGTYSVDGETLNIVEKGGESETAKIKKLTDKELVIDAKTHGGGEAKTMEFKRK
jgi:uncharacterized protein (TIGR03066 family)